MKRELAASVLATFTVQVPLTFHSRGGRKLVISPAGDQSVGSPRLRIDNTVIKAIARAHRWKSMLESGEYTTADDLAAAEKINPSYLSRILRLTLLAPNIVNAILDGRQAVDFQLDILLRPFPEEWERQCAHFRLIT